ncbi:MAG TPA: coniferyl aldehyde dehydrogenase, partial [Hyphomonadaceae bacterium]|nr:coniferyl aldehyde dehydrogenase [Hyphomonadaceae bacterium]
MREILDKQKAAHIREGAPSAELRMDRIDRCIRQLIKYKDEIADALCEDFGHRSKDQTTFTDVVSSLGPLKHSKANLRKWMKPEKRKVEAPLNLLGAKARLEYQPKGTVGI